VDVTRKEILTASPINVGEKEAVPPFQRDGAEEVRRLLEKSPLNIALTGLRRVGKTTLVKQVLNEWEGRAFYFSFDEARHQSYDVLRRVVEVFLSESGAEKPLIALDEVGKVPNWAGLVKKYYDQGKARFILTGSSSLSITKGKESLAGRLFEVHLPPLQYHEFLQLAYGERGLSDFKEVFEREPKDRLEAFIERGSFPETALMPPDLAGRYIRESVVSKIIFEDIPHIFRVQYRRKLYELFLYTVEYSGNLVYESSLAEVLGINKTTVGEYLFYLEQAFLSHLLYPEGSLSKRLRKTKKAYVASASIYKAFTSSFSYGIAAETAVFDKLSSYGGHPFFYRDAQKREVDFVWRGIPIEVKFQRSITKADVKHLLYYLKRKDRDVGVVVTRDTLDEWEVEGKRVILVPLHAFLAVKSFKNFPA